MMIYRLRVSVSPEGVVRLRLGTGWRIFFIVVTVVAVATIVHDGELRGLLPLVGLIAAFAAIYQESWEFDNHTDEVCSRVGVLLLSRIHRYRLSALRRVRVRTREPFKPDAGPSRYSSITSAVQRGYVQLILEFNEAKEGDETSTVSRPVVQTESIRNRHHVEALARELSSKLSVPLESAFR